VYSAIGKFDSALLDHLIARNHLTHGHGIEVQRRNARSAERL
jgi:hypothetical protein